MAKRKPRPRPPPSHYPWACVILAVDTGRKSGYSIWVGGKLLSFGEANTGPRVCEIVRDVIGLQYADFLAVMVLEYHPWSGLGAAAAGLAASRKEWSIAWEQAGGAKKRNIKVHLATWRAALRIPLRPKSAAQQGEMALARMKLRAHASQDEAAAYGIGLWATHAGEVGAVLTPKARERRVPR